jgi:hypothetical protein
MKYLFLTLIVTTQLSGFSHAHAGGAAGGGATEWTQIFNKVSLVASEGANKAASVAQVSQTGYDMIGRPLATALITRAVDEVANETITWANGGFDGKNPSLIVSDPGKEITKTGLIVTKTALESIPTNSMYGDSIFSAILEKNQDVSMETELTALSQSDIPTILQKNICDDVSLTNLARANVEDNAGNYTQEELAQEKRTLYDRMCAQDAANSPETAALLENVNKQNSNLGGWDSWLYTTQGNNDYTRTVLATNVVASKKGTEQTLTTNNMYQGLGSLSQTECIKKSLTTKVGEEPTCLESRILTAGKTVDARISNAVNAGAERLSNLTGEGIANAVIGFAVGKLVSGIATYKLPSSSGGGTVSLNNVSRVSNSVSTPVQDLIADPTTKKSTLKPMLADLTAFLKSLDGLEQVDTQYLQDLRTYEGEINKGKTCYQDLITNKGISASDPQITAGLAFYNKRQASVTPVKNMITDELQSLTGARNLAEKTVASLKVSNSSKEISTIFNDYQDAVDLNGYPTSQTELIRQGEYTKNKFNVDNDTNTDPSHLGEMARTYQTCQTLGTSMYNTYNYGN